MEVPTRKYSNTEKLHQHQHIYIEKIFQSSRQFSCGLRLWLNVYWFDSNRTRVNPIWPVLDTSGFAETTGSLGIWNFLPLKFLCPRKSWTVLEFRHTSPRNSSELATFTGMSRKTALTCSFEAWHIHSYSINKNAFTINWKVQQNILDHNCNTK